VSCAHRGGEPAGPVLVVPLSDVRAATLIEPSVALADGDPVGVAVTPRLGEIDKS